MIFSIYPDESSEKAISNYTKQLIESQAAQGIEVTPLEYMAGDYSTLNLEELKEGDVVHIQHEYNLFGKYGMPFFHLYGELKKKKVRVITTMHNVLSKKQKFDSGFMKTVLRKKLYKYQNEVIENSSEKVIVHAKFFKDILVNEYGMPEEKVVVLRQGILENVNTISKEEAKKELGLEGNVYLLIGSLVPDHGADVVLKQATEIGGTIVVAADSKALNDRNDERIKNWLSHLKEIVKDNDIKNVRFDIGELPYDLWWKYFAAADVVLLPYKGGIGSGIFADCIATRTPMVGSKIKYFEEFAKDYGFIDVTDKDYGAVIKSMLEKPVDSDFDNYMEQYGMTALAKKYEEIYKNE